MWVRSATEDKYTNVIYISYSPIVVVVVIKFQLFFNARLLLLLLLLVPLLVHGHPHPGLVLFATRVLLTEQPILAAERTELVSPREHGYNYTRENNTGIYRNTLYLKTKLCEIRCLFGIYVYIPQE